MPNNEVRSHKTGIYSDPWDTHKDDSVWRRFWALWELRRKWNWANWFYQNLDRAGNEIVAPEWWTLFPGPGYMKFCLWCAILRSIHEGLTQGLDEFTCPEKKRKNISDVLGPIPKDIQKFPKIDIKGFRDFRNAVFHCQWSPTLTKFELNMNTVNALDKLHNRIGAWLNSQFRNAFDIFTKHYYTPPNWIYSAKREELMPECFY